jgi:hypothetical protein
MEREKREEEWKKVKREEAKKKGEERRRRRKRTVKEGTRTEQLMFFSNVIALAPWHSVVIEIARHVVHVAKAAGDGQRRSARNLQEIGKNQIGNEQ